MTERELAYVLAALRSMQADPPDYFNRMLHFKGIDPLTYAEVDALCERLNTEAAPVLCPGCGDCGAVSSIRMHHGTGEPQCGGSPGVPKERKTE